MTAGFSLFTHWRGSQKDKKKIERAYEFKSRDAMLIFVTGHLERALREWKLIYVAQFIIEVFELGYKLSFIHIPAPKVSKNNRSALTENLNGPP